MSASLDVDVLLLACELSRLPADRLVALKRIAVKMEGGLLDVDDLAAMVGRIQDGVMTYDEGLAVLAAAH
jgi:hypothetical protein